jgi:uncharacterized membrane protein
MWWNGPAWGPMYGWWIMPIFMILFLVIIFFIVSRFFGAGGGFCGRPPVDRDSNIEELKKEIKALRDEIRDLKNKGGKGSD